MAKTNHRRNKLNGFLSWIIVNENGEPKKYFHGGHRLYPSRASAAADIFHGTGEKVERVKVRKI